MKKLLACLLSLMMLMTSFAFAEEEAAVNDYDSLTVASLTPMSGNFFNEMWGNNASDADVRALIHGYNLMLWDSDTGAYGIDPSVVSGVAAARNDDGSMTYMVSLYSDLTYNNGSPITARDYAFTVLLYACPGIAKLGAGTSGMDHIAGVKEYRSGEASVVSGVRVISDTQLNVTITAESQPDFYELSVLNIHPYPISVIAPGCVVADDGSGVTIRNEDETVTEPLFTPELLRSTLLNGKTGYITHPSVTSGPYTLTEWDPDTHTAVLEANPYYKGNHNGIKPSITHLTYTLTTEESMMDDLKSGKVGLINRVLDAQNIQDGLALTSGQDYSVMNYPRTGLSFISFNCEKPVMSDVTVRRALAMCFDRPGFIQSTTGSYGLQVDGYYGIGQWMYQAVMGQLTMDENTDEEKAKSLSALSLDGLTVYDYDPAAAADLLARDGWTKNAQGIPEKDGQPLGLVLTVSAGNKAIDSLKTCFVEPAASIGIIVTIEEREPEEMLRLYYRQEERTNDMFFMASNFSEVFDPSVTFSIAGEDQGVANRCGLRDENLFRLAEDMRATTPGDVLTYCTKWVTFQNTYTGLLPMLPIYSNVYFDFYTATLHNYNINENQTWSTAIIEAYRGDVVTELADDTEAPGQTPVQ